MKTARHSCSGFTLVEVMVALAIVAIALPALMFSLYQETDSAAYLRDKSQAQMVAANKLSQFRVLTRARESLFKGSESGVAELAGRQWFWTLKSAATEVQSFYRIDIEVREGESEDRDRPALYTLVAFMNDVVESTTEQVPQE